MQNVTLHRITLTGPWLLLAVLSAGISLAALLWPLAAGVMFVLVVLAVLGARTISGMRLWQQMTLLALLGYVVLGYGFANLTFPRIPIPVGHVFMFIGLLLALPGRKADVRKFLREPAVWCWLALMFLTMLHLMDQVPVHGIWAIRDSNFIVEGIFLLSGFLWARSRAGSRSMQNGLWWIFLVNLIYSLTYPSLEYLRDFSPRSGVFLNVPLFGTYWHNSLFLLCGALFVYQFGKQISGWPPAVISGLALLQLLWSLVFQARTTYVQAVVTILILFLTGGRRIATKAIAGVAVSVLLVGLIGTLGIEIQGRLGRMDLDFLVQHIQSLFLAPGTPGVGTIQWRTDVTPQMLDRWTSSPTTIVIGEGFGQALTEWEVSPEIGQEGTGVQVRAPHNTHISVLVRLGLLGLLFWGLMHARIAYLLIRAVREAPRASMMHKFAVWMLIFYVLAMLHTSAQPWLEFPQGAIPFYCLIGFMIALANLDGFGSGVRHAREARGSVARVILEARR